MRGVVHPRDEVLLAARLECGLAAAIEREMITLALFVVTEP